MPIRKLTVFAAVAALASIAVVVLVYSESTKTLSLRLDKLRMRMSGDDPEMLITYQSLLSEARERALIYDYLLRQDHLLRGMVINRRINGAPSSECDSLLFSSLRYVALKRLGQEELANDAWRAIEMSRRGDIWLRHPDCPRTNTSRDMIVGVLAALSQKPDNAALHLRNLMLSLRRTGGYIGEGPFHVSRLSPGLGELIRLLAKNYSIPEPLLSPYVRYSFSTLEFDVMAISRGYTSHLNALVMWVEYVLSEQLRSPKPIAQVRNVSSLVDRLAEPLLARSFSDRRHQWMAFRLVEIDHDNLFFRWLLLKASDALTVKAKVELLQELLAMPQFPENRLPADCDRKADYLWQRDSKEYVSPHPEICLEVFSGVDFLWMVSLLHEPETAPYP